VQGRFVTAHVRKARHLILRFFAHYRARPLGPQEQRYVYDHLSAPCAELFWKQGVPDQRHAITVARRVEASFPRDTAVIEAALLHDIGKWRPNPGAVARSIATILDLLHLPMTERMRAYRDHGPRGAEDLEQARCGELAIAFARLHPAPPPEGFDERRWDALMAADE
jgi:hypothetical protein